MMTKSPKPSIHIFWFSQHCWYSSHCLHLHGPNKKSNLKNDKHKVQTKHKPHLFLNAQCRCQNYTIRFCNQPVFQISSFACNKITALCCNEMYSNRYKDIGLCETSSKIYKVCGTCQFVAVRHGIIKCS